MADPRRSGRAILAISVCWLVAGCAALTPRSQPPEPPTAPSGATPELSGATPYEATPYDVGSEGRFPPPPPVEPEPASASVGDAWLAPEEENARLQGLRGYRVQVFACASRDSAEAMRREVAGRVPAPTYVEYAAPYYRVRVGDCASEAECLELRERLRRAGYTAAWTVPARILSP